MQAMKWRRKQVSRSLTAVSKVSKSIITALKMALTITNTKFRFIIFIKRSVYRQFRHLRSQVHHLIRQDTSWTLWKHRGIFLTSGTNCWYNTFSFNLSIWVSLQNQNSGSFFARWNTPPCAIDALTESSKEVYVMSVVQKPLYWTPSWGVNVISSTVSCSRRQRNAYHFCFSWLNLTFIWWCQEWFKDSEMHLLFSHYSDKQNTW